MSESGTTTLFVGGAAPVRFGVRLDQIGGIVSAADLPAERREVNLAGLFDQDSVAAAEDRYARVLGLDEPAYVRLGSLVKTLEIASRELGPIPRVLQTTAARWGWAAIHVAAGTVTIILDPLALARIGAARGTPEEAGA